MGKMTIRYGTGWTKLRRPPVIQVPMLDALMDETGGFLLCEDGTYLLAD